MGKQLESVTLCVELIGIIWEGIECTKEKTLIFTPNGKPFTQKWAGLQNALSLITKDGDFQYCTIRDGILDIKWIEGNLTIGIDVEIPKCKLTSRFLAENY